METRCARCNALMSCEPEGKCWCGDLPPRAAAPQGECCLCRGCLEHDLKAEREETEKEKAAKSLR